MVRASTCRKPIPPWQSLATVVFCLHACMLSPARHITWRTGRFGCWALSPPRIASVHSVQLSSSTTVAAAADPPMKVVVLAGPTGVGKSDVAAVLCQKFSGLIVSADSVQAYRGVDIGSNKPSAEERSQTPHLLVDVVDHTENYNAAEWTRDALYSIDRLCHPNRQKQSSLMSFESGDGDSDSVRSRHGEIDRTIDQARAVKGYHPSEALLPVVVGGTMMYLQWLVHGRPDALRPTEQALTSSKELLASFQRKEDWPGAVHHVEQLGEPFLSQVQKLSVNDWYRLRRIMEVAYTVDDKKDDHMIHQVYSGQREGSLSSFGFDVRCFFLCPDDRMNHTKVIDQRCEQMVKNGLISETTDLCLSGRLPFMATKAIGYRACLDYLERESPKDGDEHAFQDFLDQFSTATRRYAKRQMQWFRKDKEFVFVSVPISQGKTERVQVASDEIIRLLCLPRNAFDEERLHDDSPSTRARKVNEAQGAKMKTYQFERFALKSGSEQCAAALAEADACTNRFQAKKPKLDIHQDLLE